MTSTDGYLTITRNGRTTRLAPLNDATYYTALRVFGVSAAVSAALTAKLITLSNTKGAN